MRRRDRKRRSRGGSVVIMVVYSVYTVHELPAAREDCGYTIFCAIISEIVQIKSPAHKLIFNIDNELLTVMQTFELMSARCVQVFTFRK